MKPIQQKKKPKGNTFFDEMAKIGPDWATKVRPSDIVRRADMMFRDFSRGNVDINKHGVYFLNPAFNGLFITEAWARWYHHAMNKMGLEMIMQRPEMIEHPQMFKNVYETESKQSSMYWIIYTNLSSLMNTGNLGYLNQLMQDVRPFSRS